jgi:integrase
MRMAEFSSSRASASLWSGLRQTIYSNLSRTNGKADFSLWLKSRLRAMHMAYDPADVELIDNPSVSIVGKGMTRSQRLTLAPRPCAALRDWISTRGLDTCPLFTRLDPGADPAGERLTGDSICRMVARLGDRPGLKREALPHGLRRQGITRLLDLVGVDVRKVQRFSRRAKIEAVMRYDDHRRDDAGALS